MLKQQHQLKSAYTLRQKLRFPLLFGGILSFFVYGFMNRKAFFGEEIEEVRKKNYEETIRQQEIMDKVKARIAEEVASKSKAK